ncbi:YfhO family protein [Paraflavitalea speifideaquila]|uniref:YfhO family protein n=1 Tax=Paraflavitalea speifideaquila TaxID=3076558 RepID=UPI0028E328A0|nr:YfhO family protein [Paraflavitalea speifideiaquila]
MPEEQANEFAKQYSPYWGAQPSTSGAVYLGAIICFLFIVGLVFYRQWHLAWILAATLLGILLAWGSNFKAFNYFLFDHLPYYNKFRAPSIALIIPQLTVPLLAVLGLNELLSDKYDPVARWKKFKWSLYITGAVIAILAIMYTSLDYTAPNDSKIGENLSQGMLQQLAQGQQPTPEMQQQASVFGRSVVNALKDDRRSLFGGDLLRSVIFILLAAGLLAYYLKKNISAQIVAIGLVILSTIDLLGVDLRYLSHKNYHPADESSELTPTRADLQIKQDTGYFRVLDQTGGNPFVDSRASYFHNSVGGQHPARLALYDDLIQRQLNNGNMKVYNMLNTKYFIGTNPQDRQPVAQLNPEALGPCWLVKTIKYVNNADEEMNALDTFNPKDTVIIDKREQSKVPFAPQFDSTASIKLVQNLNDKITYEFNAASNQFAVFSEIYYPAGWKAFVDGKETPIVRVDYALRGLPLSAGNHAIEFRFEPEDYVLGDRISMIVGIISILVLLVGTWYLWKQYRAPNPTTKA